MGYAVEDHDPQVVFDGVTYGVGCFEAVMGPIGNEYTIGLFRLDPTQGWLEVEMRQATDAQIFADMQTVGGPDQYIAATKDYINSLLAKWCVPVVTSAPVVGPAPMPVDAASAVAFMQTAINAMKITLNAAGVPVLS